VTYLNDVGDVSGRTLTHDEWTEFFAQHDQYRAE
jgi:hypothetical protein